MRYKKIMMLAILIVAFLTVSAVTAVDNATSDVLCVNETTDEVVSVENENQEILKENEPGTFTDLADEIANADGQLTLTRDYIGKWGYYDITIDKSIEINGNGHTINGRENFGRIFYITASDVVLNNICFVNSEIDDSGGTIYWEGSNGVLSNCRFVNSTSGAGLDSSYDEVYGGAVYWYGDNNLIINCSFENTDGMGSPYGRGGAIAFEGDNNKVIGCSFANSEARNGAGAIYLKGDNGYLSDCKFVDCELHTLTGETNCVGGAVLWDGSGGVLSNCSFVDCFSIYNAGAIWCSGDNNLISYCSFEKSAVRENEGGAICLLGNDCVLSDCSFLDSHSGIGGAVYWKGSNAVIANCNFTDSYVTKYLDYWLFEDFDGEGGSIYLEGDHYKIYNCNFANSRAVYNSGGAIYLDGDNGNLSGCSFVDCSAADDGGAVYWYGDEGYLSSCSFVDCSADYGGAVYWNGYCGNLSGCSFVNCHAFGYFDEEYEEYVGGRGGAVCWYGDDGSVAESSFKGCTADEYGGGIYIGSESFSLINPTFEDNYAQEGSDWYSVEDITVIDDSKASTVITVPEYVFTTYGVSEKLVATLEDVDGNPLVGEEVSIVLNNREYTLKTNSQGKVSLSIPTNLLPDAYDATITYAGNEEYASSTTSVCIVVKYVDTEISAVYNNTACEIVATLTNANTGNAIGSANVKFNINGATAAAKTNSKGQAKVSTADLPSGTYNATIFYEGNSKYNIASTSITFATKIGTAVSAVYDAANSEIVATLTNSVTGKAIANTNVKVNINGATTTAKTNSKGQVKVSTAALPLGTNTATISYAGNSKYNSASTKITFDVKTKVIVTDVYAYSDRIVAKLTNGATGKTIANANMIVEINGVKYDAKSDNKGQLTFNTKGLNLPSAYDLTISYRGNDKYTASSATVAVDLNKANMMITTKYHADKQKLVATLKNSKTGKIVSKANMIIDLNGVKTTYKSNDQGKITLPTADFAPGTYVGTVTYPGNTRYNSISAVFKIDI